MTKTKMGACKVRTRDPQIASLFINAERHENLSGFVQIFKGSAGISNNGMLRSTLQLSS